MAETNCLLDQSCWRDPTLTSGDGYELKQVRNERLYFAICTCINDVYDKDDSLLLAVVFVSDIGLAVFVLKRDVKRQ